MPKVSVIIPVYNVEPYLARCLNSVCNQTLKDIEIICINDCSPDNSLTILQEYAEKDSRITIIDFEENRNAAIARNAGLKIAKGEYLGFVDPDDYIDLDFYEKLYEKSIAENADIVKTKRKTTELNGKNIETKLNDIIREKGALFFNYEWQSAIYKTSLISLNNITFPEECPKAQDIVFLNYCVFKANKVILIDEVYYHYIKKEGSLNAKKIPLKHIKSALKACELILKNINNSELIFSNKNTYIKLYSTSLDIIFRTLFQNDEYEAKCLCAESLISSFNICKDKVLLEGNFYFKSLLPYIKDSNITKLTEELNQYKELTQLFAQQARYNIKRNK